MAKPHDDRQQDYRRQGRTVALQSLFAADLRRLAHFPPTDWLDDEPPAGALALGERLCEGVLQHSPQLDSCIYRYAPNWPVSQLPLIDRNILRIALFELLHHPETPRKTAINEAVELAKTYGSESSARFVNGVLGSAITGLESGELTAAGPPPEGR